MNASVLLSAWSAGLGLLLTSAATSFPAATHYVDLNSTNPTPPYTNWATAATNIQDAVDAAVAGDQVVVTNGVYSWLTVSKALTVRSVNGPRFTIIDGRGTRCAYLTSGSCLSGFTLRNGVGYGEGKGGGVVCEAGEAVVSNCVITGNVLYGQASLFSTNYGGGAYGVTLNNCTVISNSVYLFNGGYSFGGGAAYCTLNNCALGGNRAGGSISAGYLTGSFGGGAYACTLNSCTLSGNRAGPTTTYVNGSEAGGGGASSCTLNDCTLTGNSVPGDIGGGLYAFGGGAHDSTLNNCALNGNSAYDEGGGASQSALNNCTLTGNCTGPFGVSGGASGCALNNCIVYFNSASSWPNYGPGYLSDSTLNYSCTTPQPTNGIGNITNAPLFADANGWADLRLQSNSPCINAGNNAYVVGTTDLDGNPRIVGGTVDIGAYEYQTPTSRISYAWLQQFGLPVNTATDTADPDGDAVDNWHEWLADTDPTNPLSSPAQLTIAPSGSSVILKWPTNAVGFTLQSTTNLNSPVWSTNFPAPVITGAQNVVTNPISGPQQFYRLVH